MSLETALYAALHSICPRVYPDIAPADAVLPYVTWQQIGGEAPVYLDGALPDKRCAYVQINTWAATRAEANALMLQIEQALCAASTMVARPQSALQAAFDDDTEIRGAMQDFEIWAER